MAESWNLLKNFQMVHSHEPLFFNLFGGLRGWKLKLPQKWLEVETCWEIKKDGQFTWTPIFQPILGSGGLKVEFCLEIFRWPIHINPYFSTYLGVWGAESWNLFGKFQIVNSHKSQLFNLFGGLRGWKLKQPQEWLKVETCFEIFRWSIHMNPNFSTYLGGWGAESWNLFRNYQVVNSHEPLFFNLFGGLRGWKLN